MKYSFLPLALFLAINSHALTNSTIAEDSAFDALAFISSPGVDRESGDIVPGYCNATIINERTLVTAAHCIFEAEALRRFEISIDVGQYRYVKKPNEAPRRIGYAAVEKVVDNRAQFVFPTTVAQKIARSGTRATIDPQEDFAVINLSVALPLEKYGIKILPTVSREEWLEIQRTKNIPSPTVVTINPFEEISTNDTRRMGTLNNLTWTGGSTPWFESKSITRVNPGDSGAPVFVKIQNQWKILAVTKGAAKSFFSTWDVFCPVGNYLHLIR